MDEDPVIPRTSIDGIFHTDPPWIRVGEPEPEGEEVLPSYFYGRVGLDVCVRRLRGHKMRTVSSLMDEFAAAFQFFDGFGENWLALSDCLQCLNEWMPADAYVVLIDRAQEILADEGEALPALLTTLDECAEAWSREVRGNGHFDRNAIPFQVLFNVSDGVAASKERLTSAAGVAAVEVVILD